MILTKFQCYEIDKVLALLQGCFNDINTVIEFQRYGYIHDVGFYVIVRTSTQKDIANGYNGISISAFKKKFVKELKYISCLWNINISSGYRD